MLKATMARPAAALCALGLAYPERVPDPEYLLYWGRRRPPHVRAVVPSPRVHARRQQPQQALRHRSGWSMSVAGRRARAIPRYERPDSCCIHVTAATECVAISLVGLPDSFPLEARSPGSRPSRVRRCSSTHGRCSRSGRIRTRQVRPPTSHSSTCRSNTIRARGRPPTATHWLGAVAGSHQGVDRQWLEGMRP